MTRRQFGVSTHLFHHERLCRDHLLAIAAHGFETVEVFATPSHFDYRNVAAVADLQQWLAEAGLELHGTHAPVAERYENGRWSGLLSIASAEAEERVRAVREAEQALHIARRIPTKVLVTHLGLPDGPDRRALPADSRASARRSIEELVGLAAPLGVRVVVEVIPNELSRAGSLVHFIEEDLDVAEELKADAGVCLDFGHAHLAGDLVDAIETLAEHLITTHVHDNRGRHDDHLVPLEGTIDWPSALTAVQKVGYDGPFVFEIAAHGSSKATLARARTARAKLERMLAQ